MGGINKSLHISSESLIDKLLWIGFSLWLIIDVITGYALNNGLTFPLSQGFKLLILLLLLIRVSRWERYLKISFILLLYLSLFTISLILHERNLSHTFIHLTKLISTFYLYVYFCAYIKLGQSNFIIKADKVLTIAFIIVSINIVGGLAGIGFHTYPDEQVGYKGFFFAGNELGGVITALIPFLLYVVYLNYSLYRYVIFSLFVMLLSYILATKSVLIASFLCVIIIPWILGTKKERKRICVLGLLMGIPLLSLLILKMLSSESELVLKLVYAYNTNGVKGLIFSGRDEFLAERGDEFYDGDFLTKLMGIGGNISVEIDPIDSLLNYGYVGFVITIIIYAYLLCSAYKYKKNNSFVPVLIFQNWLILMMSIIAGHIMYSSMAGLYISLTNSLVFFKSKSKCIVDLKRC